MTCACLHFPDSPEIRRIGLGVPAMRCQQMGYAVLPLQRGGKRPHRMLGDQGGVYHASLNPQQAVAWWSADPAANIGIACGQASQLVVIDLDVKGGTDGVASFYQFMEGHGLGVSTSAMVSTPSGGTHLWIRIPGPVPERPAILPGVDVKGDGGLVVAPPSMLISAPLIRPGERAADPVPVPYQWAAGCPHLVPAAPDWLLPWLHEARPVPAASGTVAGASPELETLIRTGIPRGQRNSGLYRLACSRFRVHGTGPAGWARVADELRQVLAAGDTADFSSRELTVILRSARAFVTGSAEAEEREWQKAREMIAWDR